MILLLLCSVVYYTNVENPNPMEFLLLKSKGFQI